jgi:DNA-binding LacI/PurR family transcriptional regulator
MIAVMIADISNPFYHHITRTIQDIAAQHNYDVLISNTDHIEDYEMRFYEAMMRRPVDGIIMVPYHLTNEHVDALYERTGAAIAILGNHIDHPSIDTVSADDETATYDAVRWLIDARQHRKIGFLGASPTFQVSQRRQRGYERALRDAGLSINPNWIQTGEFAYESGAEMMQVLLSQPERPSAVFACNDFIAIGALNAALDSGLEIPRDLAIVGFDNVPAATFVRPRLTTVAQFPAAIGRELAEAIFSRMSSDTPCEGRKYNVPCELVVRQST